MRGRRLRSPRTRTGRKHDTSATRRGGIGDVSIEIMRHNAESEPRHGASPHSAPMRTATSRQGEAHRAGERLGLDAYRAIYDNSPEGVLFTAPDGRVLAANSAACGILGRSEAEICALGRQGMSDHSDKRWARLLAERRRTGRVQGVARMIRGDGAVIEVEMSAKVFRHANGEQRTCTTIRDVTERLKMEQELVAMSARLREMTLTDELTGLRNRRGFATVVPQVLDLAERKNATAHLLFLDVDNLKRLNDDYGHDAGDAAIRAVARALSHALRREDVVSRIGGDEFVALILELDEAGRTAVEARIRECLVAESAVAGLDRTVEASIGWAVRASGGATVEDLLAEADRAMYRAKKGDAPPQNWGAKPQSTVLWWGVVRGWDLNDPLKQARRAVPAAAGPAPGGHPHGEWSAGRNEGRVRR